MCKHTAPCTGTCEIWNLIYSTSIYQQLVVFLFIMIVNLLDFYFFLFLILLLRVSTVVLHCFSSLLFSHFSLKTCFQMGPTTLCRIFFCTGSIFHFTTRFVNFVQLKPDNEIATPVHSMLLLNYFLLFLWYIAQQSILEPTNYIHDETLNSINRME